MARRKLGVAVRIRCIHSMYGLEQCFDNNMDEI
jgi:hypothetical protein